MKQRRWPTRRWPASPYPRLAVVPRVDLDAGACDRSGSGCGKSLVGSEFLMADWAAGITLCYCGLLAEGLHLLRQVPHGEDTPLLFEFAHLMTEVLDP